jgi:hypothetical protein
MAQKYFQVFFRQTLKRAVNKFFLYQSCIDSLKTQGVLYRRSAQAARDV